MTLNSIFQLCVCLSFITFFNLGCYSREDGNSAKQAKLPNFGDEPLTEDAPIRFRKLEVAIPKKGEILSRGPIARGADNSDIVAAEILYSEGGIVGFSWQKGLGWELSVSPHLRERSKAILENAKLQGKLPESFIIIDENKSNDFDHD